MEEFYLLTFKNTHDAIGCEKVLKENNLEPVVMPTPTYITKSCGLSIKISTVLSDEIKKLYLDKKINVKNIFIYKGKELSIVKIDE